MISVKRKLLQAINTSFSRHFPEYSMFGHFWPFFTICACLWATPWTHLRFYWQICYHWVRLQWSLRRKSYSRLLLLHSPTIFLKIPFLAILTIFHHLFLLVGDPLTPSPLLLTKMLSLGAVAMISTEREQLQAITTPFPPFAKKLNFWSFLGIFQYLCLLMGDPLIPPQLLLIKMLSLGAVTTISTERKLLQAIATLFFPHMP